MRQESTRTRDAGHATAAYILRAVLVGMLREADR
jgi:hypothetical protein